MSGSIRKSIVICAAVILTLFVFVSFAVSYTCVRYTGDKYRESVANSALDYAETVIDAEKAKEIFLTRDLSDYYFSVQGKIKDYKADNADAIKRISLVNFNNSGGSYIYDSEGAALGTRLEYDDYTSSTKAELINGRNSIVHKELNLYTAYRPVRTVDDSLCGYIIVELNKPYELRYFRLLVAAFAAMFVMSILLLLIFVVFLNSKILRPIRKMADYALFLSGDDSAEDQSSTAAVFNTDRHDEVGRLGEAFQKIFVDMNRGAQHLSQAIYDANHDGMTQHFNKRFYHTMEENFRSCKSIGVIYFDVNNLKLMNDTLGHERGDYVIKAAAEYIRRFLGEGDYCFRMGGDEFLAVFTNCTFRRLDKIMDRLDMESPYILSRKEDDIKCALSYGCSFGKGSYSYENVLAEAEENMYAKKAELKRDLRMPDR